MGLFVCPDIHEIALLHFMEQLKRPRKSILSNAFIIEKVTAFLETQEENFPGIFSSPSAAHDVICALEDIGFFIKLEVSDNKSLNTFVPFYLVPSMRPVGEFHWTYNH